MLTGKFDRGTGRTTRMIGRAVRMARNGGKAVLVGADSQHRLHLEHQARKVADEMGAGWVITSGNLRITSLGSMGVSEHRGVIQVLGVLPEGVFVDHYALERRFSELVEQFQRAYE